MDLQWKVDLGLPRTAIVGYAQWSTGSEFGGFSYTAGHYGLGNLTCSESIASTAECDVGS